MIKRIISYLLFAVLAVLVFNLLDYLFDRFISHGPFTFDTLSNILPAPAGTRRAGHHLFGAV